MKRILKILVVDDTIFYRTLLSRLVEEIPHAEVTGVASNGELAVKKVELSRPDLVLMDVAMPRMDGLQALETIKKDHPGVDVVMVSGVDFQAANLAVKALEKGALEVVPKPRTDSRETATAELKSALLPLIKLARTRANSRQAGEFFSAGPVDAVKDPLIQPAQPEAVVKKKMAQREKREIKRIDLVALGVSTGGPNTLKKIIPRIMADFPVPILAVQHMPPVFTATLSESLNKMSSISVKEGSAGQIVENGCMYIAPGGRHMVVRNSRSKGLQLDLADSPPVHNCRPAVDVLFRSIALGFGGNVLAVILTGMGRDGASGVAAIRRKGGFCLVQDKATSVVWGMPGAVAEAGDADEIHPEEGIAERIMQIVKRGR